MAQNEIDILTDITPEALDILRARNPKGGGGGGGGEGGGGGVAGNFQAGSDWNQNCAIGPDVWVRLEWWHERYVSPNGQPASFNRERYRNPEVSRIIDQMAKLQVDDPKNVEYGTALLQELVKGMPLIPRFGTRSSCRSTRPMGRTIRPPTTTTRARGGGGRTSNTSSPASSRRSDAAQHMAPPRHRGGAPSYGAEEESNTGGASTGDFPSTLLATWCFLAAKRPNAWSWDLLWLC